MTAHPAAAATTVMTETERLVWSPTYDPQPPAGAHLGLTLGMTKSGGSLVMAAADAGTAAGWVRPGDAWAFSSALPLGDAHEPPVGTAHGAGLTTVEEAGTTSIVGVPGGFEYITGITGGAVTAVAMRDATSTWAATIAIGQSTYSSNRGRVRVYELAGVAGWQLVKTFLGTPGERLGKSLAISGGIIAAGAPKYGDNGAVRIYARGSVWVDWQLIESPATSQTDARFGAAVAISGIWMVVGSPNLDRTITPGAMADRGGIYFYRPSYLLWELFGMRFPSEAGSHDRFGASVDIHGTRAAAGAPGDDVNATDDGAAYYYAYSSADWQAHLRLVDSAGAAGDALGTSVGVGPLGVVAGAPNADANGVADQGAVLFYGIL